MKKTNNQTSPSDIPFWMQDEENRTENWDVE